MKEMNDKIYPHSKPTLGKEEEEAVIEVIRSGQIAQGPKVEEFERMLSEYIGKKYAVAVSSGLSALHLSLIGLGIREGEEVILPSYTCDALLHAVHYVKAKPVLVDVNYEDGNISIDRTLEVISPQTKAIIIPHAFGFPADLDAFLSLGLEIIEDCATSVGGAYKGRKLGSYGEIAVFSFYATKMIATGEGGMVLTDDEEVANEIREVRDYNKKEMYKLRFNYKMTDIEASLGIRQLRKLPYFLEKRKALFKRYIELLEGREDIILPRDDYGEGTTPSFYRFIIKLPGRATNHIMEMMKRKGVICAKPVFKPLHRLLGLAPSEFPNSERLDREALSLPLYPSLNFEDIEYIAGCLLEVLEVN